MGIGRIRMYTSMMTEGIADANHPVSVFMHVPGTSSGS